MVHRRRGRGCGGRGLCSKRVVGARRSRSLNRGHHLVSTDLLESDSLSINKRFTSIPLRNIRAKTYSDVQSSQIDTIHRLSLSGACILPQANATMDSFDYVEIPSYATPLHSTTNNDEIRPIPKVETGLPHPDLYPAHTAPAATPSPASKTGFNLPQTLLSSALHLPANAPATPRGAGKGNSSLLSTRDPLSIQIMSVNFKRFVSKSGSVFWLQDRIEEIVMWKKGWQHTAVFMAGYAFICTSPENHNLPGGHFTHGITGYFPRLILLVPHFTVLVIMLANHPSLRNVSSDALQEDNARTPSQHPPEQPGEGSIDWLANVQAIQNVIGA